jgi:hypothetical protein
MPEAKKKVPMADIKAKAPVAKKAPKDRVKVDMSCSYENTGTYKPKAEQNIKSWLEVQAVLPATYKEIQEKIPQHTDFVGYLIRRGGLAPK